MAKQVTPWLHMLSLPELEAWRKRGSSIRFQEGQTIFYRGHEPYGVYVLCSGTIELHQKDPKYSAPEVVAAPALIGVELVLEDHEFPRTGVAHHNASIQFVPKSVVKDWAENEALEGEHYGRMP